MNTIEYGQGAVNNTIGWGQGAKVGGSSFSNLKSIALDGVDDYVDCGDLSSLSSATEFSVSLWFRKTSTSNRMILDFKDGTSRIAIQLYSPTQIYIYINGVNGLFPVSTSSNTWYHLSYVFNGSGAADSDKLKFYINGLEVTATSYSTNVPTSLGVLTSSMVSNLGALFNNTLTFRGNLDEVSVFNTELSASAVTTIYNSGAPNDISSLSPLSWWRCGDGDTAPTLTDNGSGGNNGTMTNFSTFSTDVPT